MSSFPFLYPFFFLYLPIQYWMGSKGFSGYFLFGSLLLGTVLFWFFNKRKQKSFKTIPPFVWLVYWSLIVFIEGIFYTKNALDSFLLGDFDYTAQARMMFTLVKGNFFETQYYGLQENANFLSHHMAPAILLLSPFPILFGSELGFGIGVFFLSALTLPLLYFYLRESFISEELSLSAVLLWAGSSSFYRLGHSLHFEVLIPFLFLLLLIGIQKQKPWLWILSLVLFLGIKEDLSIYAAGLSSMLIFTDTKRKKEWIGVFLLSLIYFGILHPFLNSFVGDSAGRNWKEYWGNAETNPYQTILNYIQNPESIRQYAKGLRDLSLEWGFWNLIGGWLLLPFLGLYSVFRLSVHPWVREMYSYYIYPLIPFLILFLKNGAERIQGWIEKKEKIPFFPFSREEKLKIFLIFTFLLSVYRNGKDGQYPIQLAPQKEKASELRTILKEIPEGSFVSAGFHISPFVSFRNSVYPIRDNRVFKEWIVFDHGYNSPYVSSEKIRERIQEENKIGRIELISKTKHFSIYKNHSQSSNYEPLKQK
ncbi:hypothetical protein A0128_13700 [Leptospira tipperaryensis]|uniref:DUF2079 domain-containing protein n=1 Tax=Leptospira tipperaryensis TaxID=2564040 RepID=A0A1D7UZ16_9LEPT|nr:DUF2079 domain-containing protein [Leptospira tipperaryensis]AOP34812.1 hypothetical protein A0128_13700 [Leptospira tipperaryensis]